MFKSKPRSFVLRKGRVTSAQRSAIINLWQDYVIEPESEQVKFAEVFNNQNPVIADIGFGSGDTLLFLAKTNPEINFLGIEVYLSGIGSSLAGAGLNDLKNIRIINRDADLVMSQNILKGSLDGIVLFYPDPWPKRKHHKRRLVQSEFLDLSKTALKKEGFFFCKTDWEDYSNHIIKTFGASEEWAKKNIDSLPPSYSEIPSTTYEKKAIREGRELKKLIYRVL